MRCRAVFDITTIAKLMTGDPNRSERIAVLALDFPQYDAARIGELNVRANEGQLTDDEQAELEAYINIGDLLACWQSQTRRTMLHHA